MARLSGSSRGRSLHLPTRRKSTWVLGPGSQTQQNIVASALTVIGLGSSPTGEGNTIVRIRGHLSAYLDAASAANNGFAVTLGIGIVTDQAFAIGATALPNPNDDTDWSWLWTHYAFVMSPTGTVGEAPTAARLDVVVDTKAMRKIKLNEIVFMVMDSAERGTAGLRVDFDSRMLIKLP